MGFLKRTNKKFEYKPRFYKGEGNPYQIKHKFDDYRSTVGKNKGIMQQLSIASEKLKDIKKFNKTIVLIAAVLFFIFFYLIDFDFSIFFS